MLKSFMSFVKKKMVRISLFFVLLFSFGFISGCSGTVEIPPEVCEYGDTILDVAQMLVDTFPNVPPAITTYIELARVNLQILCESEPGSTSYNESINSLDQVTRSLKIEVDKFKQTLEKQKQ